MPELEQMIRWGGFVHFGILSASAMVPFVLDWRKALAPLSAFMRRLIWVYGAFIVLTIVGFAALSLLHADTLAGGEPLARHVCGFIAIFWLARLTIQFTVLQIKDVGKSWWHYMGYHVLTLAFVFLVLIYGWAAAGPAQVSSPGSLVMTQQTKTTISNDGLGLLAAGTSEEPATRTPGPSKLFLERR